MITLSEARPDFGKGKFGFSPLPVSIKVLNDTDVCFFLLYNSSSFSIFGVITEKFLTAKISSRAGRVDRNRTFTKPRLLTTAKDRAKDALQNIFKGKNNDMVG